MKILLVEDEPVSRTLLHEALEERGHEVVSTWRPAEAIELGRQFQPDVILSDWRLSDPLDGVDVCRAILEHHPGAQVVLMSAYPAIHAAAERKGVRPAVTLEKPMGYRKLVSQVLSVLLPMGEYGSGA